jgi:RNA polymerase sigma-70 factor (ECF subfamily)
MLEPSPVIPHDVDDRFRALVESHQSAVRVHCYRMLGSLQDAEDLTQETLLRAWRNLQRYEGRGSVRGWLYRIATNACLDELQHRRRRTLPMLTGSPSTMFVATEPVPAEIAWLEPFPDAWLEPVDNDPGPEARYETKESIELAFVAALQRLAPRQRAVLILRDVLGWPARDVAELLETSVTAVNSSLQRARATLDRPEAAPARLTPDEERALVDRYVRAWEGGDEQSFVALLKDDAILSMPPLPEWYVGRAAIAAFFRWATGPMGAGPFRYLPTRANNALAFGIYAAGKPFVLQVVETDARGIANLTSFMYSHLFPHFGLPAHLE